MLTDYPFFIFTAYSITGIILGLLLLHSCYRWYRAKTLLARYKQQSEGAAE